MHFDTVQTHLHYCKVVCFFSLCLLPPVARPLGWCSLCSFLASPLNWTHTNTITHRHIWFFRHEFLTIEGSNKKREEHLRQNDNKYKMVTDFSDIGMGRLRGLIAHNNFGPKSKEVIAHTSTLKTCDTCHWRPHIETFSYTTLNQRHKTNIGQWLIIKAEPPSNTIEIFSSYLVSVSDVLLTGSSPLIWVLE